MDSREWLAGLRTTQLAVFYSGSVSQVMAKGLTRHCLTAGSLICRGPVPQLCLPHYLAWISLLMHPVIYV